jgi:hypothetical protein
LNNNLPVADYEYTVELNNSNIIPPNPATGTIHVINAQIPDFTIEGNLSTTKTYSEEGGQYNLGTLTTSIDGQGYTIAYSVNNAALPPELNGKVTINSSNQLLVNKDVIPGD